MRGKKRPPEERVSNVAGPLPPCRICGEQAAGFHYGVNTCEACKGFFRRSLLRNGEYECIGKGNCVIGTNRRKSCPKCRYLKCLAVGMSKEAIKTGRYTYMKRTQDTLELKMLAMTKQGSSTEGSDMETNSLASELGGSTASSSQTNCPSISISQASFTDSPYPGSSSELDGQSRIESTAGSPLESGPYSAAASPNVPTPNSSVSGLSSTLSSPQSRLGDNLPYTEKFSTVNCGSDLAALSKPSTSLQTPPDPNFNIHSPLCTSLLSPQSPVESMESSPGSHRFQNSPSKYSQFSDSFSSTSSALTAETVENLTETWQELSEMELDDLINTMVTSHRQIIQDTNSMTEEHLQAQLNECKERCQLQTQVFGSLGQILKKDYDHIYTTTGLDVDDRLHNIHIAAEKMDEAIRQSISFIKKIPGFKLLCLEDQTALIKAAIFDISLLSYFRGYWKEENIVVESTLSYCRHQLLALYSQEYLDLIFNLAHELQQLGLTFDMIVILKAICLFFPDRAVLKAPRLVEHLLYNMVQCLLLLLRRQWQEQAGMKFARIIYMLTHSRSVTEEAHKVLKNLSEHEVKAISKPIVIELFFGNHSNLSQSVWDCQDPERPYLCSYYGNIPWAIEHITPMMSTSQFLSNLLPMMMDTKTVNS